MRAVQLVRLGAPVENREVATPVAGPLEVLVRVRAAGICRSDAHYRNGTSDVAALPLTLGHEVAGEVAGVGNGADGFVPGDRVCIHYLCSCGNCVYCRRGAEQFCTSARMIGKHIAGGWAEYIAVPARSVLRIPPEVPLEHAAILMCSSATAYHALRVCRTDPGDRVAVFGAGGLGLSAVQLASAVGAEVFAVDREAAKLELAAYYGAGTVNARSCDVSAELRDRTGGTGVDVAVDFTGDPEAMGAALRSLAPFGRLGLVAITRLPFAVDTYGEVIARELSVHGVSDHLMSELPALLRFAARGLVDLSRVVQRTVDLDALEINGVLDALDAGRAPARTVVVPG